MTIPIIPGPFQFLGEAGQAAGAYGEEEKQRKQRLSQIAEKGYTRIIDLIMAGADPGMLDDPGIQKMGQMGFGFHVPAKAMALVGAAEREKQLQATKEIELNVPAAVAEQKLHEARTGAVTADVTGRTAAEFLKRGGPEAVGRLQMTQALVAQGQGELNLLGLEFADAMFGPNKEFTNDVVWAASGVLDARLARETASRQLLSFDRQLLLGEQTSLRDLLREGSRQFQVLHAQWEQRRRAELFGKSPEEVATWEADPRNAEPTPYDVQEDLLEQAGMSREEFWSRWREAFHTRPHALGVHEPGRTHPPGGDAIPGVPGSTVPGEQRGGPPPTTTTDPVVIDMVERAKGVDPEKVGQHLAQSTTLQPTQKSMILLQLRRTMPGAAYRKVKRAFDEWSRAAREAIPGVPSVVPQR